MRADSTPRIARVLALTALCFLFASAAAECVRWKPPQRSPNVAPDLDGPGSFGELQNTVTLDCLKYVGSIEKNGMEHVLIKDERGKVHVLRRGSYMGENHGVISKIDSDGIYINQLIERNGQWEEVIVRFPKRPDAR
jgi:Tfp pilus assembly protein PilP